MSSLTVMLVRHAEKPDGDFPGPGLSIDGTEDDKALVIRGWQRAGAWAGLFGSGWCSDYAKPNKIYAARPEPISKGAKFSRRPWTTAMPTADRLELTLDTTYGVGQEHELATEMSSLTGVVLVFWEHKTLVANLIPALVGDQRLPGLPTKWDGQRFDVVLRFDRETPEAPWSFRQLSPRLLAGDSDAPFSHVVP